MRIIRLALGAILLAFALQAQRVTVTVLATTDLHGCIYPFDYYTGRPAQRGLAKIATLVREARRENPNSMLIDCGDTIQGSPLESVYQRSARTGRGLRQDPMMLAMNQLGYEAMVVGNHEFNFGLQNLEKARSDARFPWISASIATGPGGGLKPFQPYIVKTIAGVKVGVIGITTPGVPNWEPPENYRGLRFLPGTEAAGSAVRELRRGEQPDLVVAAVHAGLGSRGENMASGIAAGVPGIDAIVFGHSHRREAGLWIGNVLLVQPEQWGLSLARLDFDLEKTAQGWKMAGKRSRLVPVSGRTAADPEILRLAKPYHDLAERYLDTPVAEAPADLDSRFGRVEDTALVDAIQEVQLYYAQADVSFTASFNPGVRVPKGLLTVRQVAALYPYDNQLYAIDGNGQMVKESLENAARFFLSCHDPACAQGPLINRAIMGYNYDMAQGVTYAIDLTKPVGQRIRDLRWKGSPLKPEQKLRIAVSSYRAGGSGGYVMFRGAKVLWRSNQDLRDLIVSYFTGRRRLPAKPDNNWRVVPEAARRTLEADARGARNAR